MSRLKAKRQLFHSFRQPIVNANKKKSKADQTVIGICIILFSIWKSTGCLRQGVTNCGFRKLIRHNLREKVGNLYGIDAVKTSAFFFCWMILFVLNTMLEQIF